MADDTSILDDHRGMAAQKATEARRLDNEVVKDQLELKARQEELEKFLFAAPAENWAEAAERARYLLKLFAETPAAEDPRRQHIISALIADFDRLLEIPAHANDDTKPA